MGRWTLREDISERVGAINRRITGWSNYFSYGSLWIAYVKLDKFLQACVRRWLVKKHKVGTRGERRYPAEFIYGSLGLVNLPKVLPLRKP